jgi:hypothetical protein
MSITTAPERAGLMRKKEGLVQAHAGLPKLACMVLGNVTRAQQDREIHTARIREAL